MGPVIRYELQPANSPEMNVNDLGFFRSLAKKAQAGGWRGKNIPDLIERVQEEFQTYHVDKLERLFKMKTAVLKLIIENKGTNTFDIPHGLLRS